MDFQEKPSIAEGNRRYLSRHAVSPTPATHEEAVEALRRAEAKYRSIVENAVEGIFQTTPNGHYLSANPALARIYGYNSCEELIHSIGDIERQLYVDATRRDDFVVRMERDGVVTSFESQIYRKDRSVIWISENATLPKYRDVIDGEFIRLIYATSPLHDIGKVGIPDHVLLKPGLLNASEFEIMKTHALLGAETLGAALDQFPQAKFLKMACEIAATHHERWDGTGYPHGLAGEAIPLCGRIVAVADVYDALSSKRAYKEAYSHDVSRSIIVDGKGKHFDSDVVEAFLAIEDQFLAIVQRFSEQLAAVS